MSQSKIRLIRRLQEEAKLTDEQVEGLVLHVSNDQTMDMNELTNTGLNLLIRKLQQIQEDRKRRMRGKIIYYLCRYGMVLPGDKPDYQRINRYIRNIGANNPREKKLYDLSPEEMRNCLNQVEQMVKKELNWS